MLGEHELQGGPARLLDARGGREDRHALAGWRVAGGYEAGLAFDLDDAHAAGAGGAAAF